MNCVECRELLVGYIEEMLDAGQNQAVKSHMDTCAECRKELEQAISLRNRLVVNGAIHGQNDLENAVMDRIFREQALKLRKVNQGKQNANFWRFIMSSPITKLAVAAVFMFAVLTGIYLITGKTPSVTGVVWAEVAQRVEAAKNCICKMKIAQTGGSSGQKVQNVNSTMYISSDYGYRMDNYADGNLVQQMFVSPKEKVITNVMHSQKTYMRMVITDEMTAEMKNKNQDPRDMIKNLLSGISPGMSGQFTNLGRKTIEGVDAEGIEVVNPKGFEYVYGNFIGRMWVDVKTELPVRIEIEAEVPIGTEKIEQSIVMNGFEWEVALEPSIFKPNIPADYKMTAEVQAPGQDEAGAIAGLKLFAEISDGRYPSQMNVMTAIQEAAPWLQKQLNLSKSNQDDERVQKEMTQKAMVLQGPSMFYAQLAQQGKDPAYYGKDVKAGDANSILMRWKISEGSYRVIYGDLSAENVTAEKLKEMERAAHQ
ncbi:MAG: zf-HC2 domain-containing protein [Sedimentisphaerales bacterium]|jgi:hypothetical protein